MEFQMPEANSFQSSPTRVIATVTEIYVAGDPLITPPPELRLRNALPEPRPQADCGQISQQASQSAAQAIQQASQQAQQSIQQAQQSIQQAQQSASQQIQQATQAAARSVTDAQNSASQAIAAASRTASQASASASFASVSAQSAVASALSRMSAAESSQSQAQSQASSVMLQAGAAVAAATGSAAAAGSSFLAAAALATAGAQASVSGFAALASSQIQASQVQAITATQVALAIVGSIIASALITILIYFLISRRNNVKKDRKKASRERAESDVRKQRELDSPPPENFPKDLKFTPSDQDSSTVVGSVRGESMEQRNEASMQFRPTVGNDLNIKETSVRWNPNKPPKAPKLSSWLQEQTEQFPVKPIQLPINKQGQIPLGGQLKSPSRTIDPPTTVFRLAQEKSKPLAETAKRVQVVSAQKAVQVVQRNPSKKSVDSAQGEVSGPPGIAALARVTTTVTARERDSRVSQWTDDTRRSFSPPPAPMLGPGAVSQDSASVMQIPAPVAPVRNTAEWLASQSMSVPMSSQSRDSDSSLTVGWRPPNRGSSGNAAKVGLPSQVRMQNPTPEWGTVGKAY
ncbi:hypothetical protein BP5796_10273 [Coleophoma crateriformis]|uniref:Uncharacterized protein n=1 Tax=Coleophoma crateriformis TaxID=565419 RepID=A0A3D8QV69_9HELO|nr:hypothetical protein BP5796_10273 [Coleophoma crateriformis]